MFLLRNPPLRGGSGWAAEGPGACLLVRMLNLCASLTPKWISTCYLAIWKDWHTVEFWLKTEW